MHDSEFVRQYESFVRGIARQTVAQLDLDCELDDLIAFGFEGLLEARGRFDASRNVPFKSFAYYRVRGAIIDGVRRMAYLPRRAYARLKAAEAVDGEGEQIQDSSASSTRDVEGSLRSIDGILGRVAAAYATAATAVGETDADDSTASPEHALIASEQRERVRAALSVLNDDERALVRGHYLEGRRFDEIARELGVSKSWASRMHTGALEKLRKALEA